MSLINLKQNNCKNKLLLITNFMPNSTVKSTKSFIALCAFSTSRIIFGSLFWQCLYKSKLKIQNTCESLRTLDFLNFCSSDKSLTFRIVLIVVILTNGMLRFSIIDTKLYTVYLNKLSTFETEHQNFTHVIKSKYL